MAVNDWLAEQFEEKRRHLRGVAYWMPGSLAEADVPCRKRGCRPVADFAGQPAAPLEFGDDYSEKY
jgi:hypothetical protein